MELVKKIDDFINNIFSRFKTTKLFSTVEDLYQDMINKKNDYYNHRIDKYVVSYNIQNDQYIEVKSNIGRTRKVANNEYNIKRLDQVIVRSKVEIARKIDEYEKESGVRLFILLTSLMMLSLSFLCVIASFFIGNYILLLAALCVFSIIMSLSFIEGSNLYILVKEIKSLKQLTGYKLDNELELPKIKECLNITNEVKN